MIERPRPEGDRLPALVGAQAARAPEALAVVDGERRLTYGELETRAGRLAGRLRRLGAGPDVPVALVTGRSIEMVVGALGILKAGAAYVPIDPDVPADRLAFMLDDAGPAVVVTVEALAGRLPAGRPLIVLDGGAERADAGPPAPPGGAGAAPHHLAYVVYTSGSTGRPKGVELTRAGLLNLVAWHRRAFALTAADRSALMASPGFDASVWEVWPVLAAGACLVVADPAARLDPVRLRDWLVAQRITVTFVPTPLAERLLGLAWPPGTPLRVLLTGGDALHRYPPPGLPFVLVNNYGPTETTVVATSAGVEPADRPARRPPIGRPIDNVRVYLVDDRGRPVEGDEPGELWIGGAGVARGYRHRPDLTAEKFVPDPFAGEPGARLYRTGDLARRRPDGQLEFLGRLDEQVKVRGHRIEPDEVAAALDRVPGVAASVVTAREDVSGDARLVAYVVPADGAPPPAGVLRRALAAVLPDAMVPSVFVRLPALPLTASGKVDRAALPAPDDANVLRDGPFAAPRTPVERRLAAILADLLGVEQVGADDNFFLLGGHSLLGAQLVARVADAFGVELPLRTVFDAPTVSGLAAEVERLILAALQVAADDGAPL